MILFAVSAAAQIASDGISTTVSRTLNIAPDESDFSVIVSVPLATTQQQVTQILLDAGIANPAIVGVAAGQSPSYAYPPSASDSQMFYQVAFVTDPAAAASFAKKLDGIRTNLPETLASFQYTAVLSASQTAVNTARQAVLAQLLSDARAKAQSLATAASLTLGAIQGISESIYSTPGIAASLVTNITTGVSSSTSAGGNGTQYTFYVTVKFAAN